MKNALLLLFLIFLCYDLLPAQERWSVELMGAGVYNVPLPLTIRQQGQPELTHTARFTSEPFVLPVYYDWRLSRWQDERSWELEFIHHKLYLDNTTAEIQKFNISHGFNLLLVNRGFDHQLFRYRVGAGVVIAHPESQVRGLTFGSSTDDNDWGYYLSGPVLQGAINRRFFIGERFFVTAEAKTTLAYASVKVAQGRADVYSWIFHLLVGVGVEVGK
ncbi:MAG TPA: hypothetical protein VFG54_03205 [Prolixibacteraceae bacterium]|nr:hypothetical protein [Prolixibacteraceae bacterium]